MRIDSPFVRPGRLACTLAGAAALALGWESPASAQFEGYLEKVTDIHLSISCWEDVSEVDEQHCPSTSGYGLEVIWNLGSVGWGTRYPRTPSRRLVRVETSGGPGSPAVVDSIFEMTPRSDTTKHYATVEVGLGYSQFSGLRSADPAFELHGTVRELPAVSVYFAFPTLFPYLVPGLSWLTPYVGGRTGLIRLQNAQLVGPPRTETNATVYSGAAEAFQLGGAVGMAIGPARPVQGVVELAYHWRRFPSVQWSTGTASLPRELPRELELSGPTVSLGVQVKLRDPR